jgi:Zn-dependent peptidase ImmA (M78 family)
MSPPTKAMMMLSYRHLSNDQFWFSVFHELAHLLLHAEDETILDDWDDSVTAKEYEADRFAADTLIPPDRQRELSSLRDDRSIIGFAQSIGVSRGIVVGQMQHHGIIGHERFNHLKTFYQWNDKNQVEKRSR